MKSKIRNRIKSKSKSKIRKYPGRMKPDDASRRPTRVGVFVFAPFAAWRFNRFMLRR